MWGSVQTLRTARAMLWTPTTHSKWFGRRWTGRLVNNENILKVTFLLATVMTFVCVLTMLAIASIERV